MQLFINRRASSPKVALVRDQLNATPVRMQDIVIADTLPLEVYVVDGLGGFDAMSAGSGISLRVGLGLEGATPTAGTFKLALGANQSASIAYNADAAAIQTALAGTTGIGSGNVSVSGTWPVFVVEFIGTLANTNVSTLTSDSGLLTPSSAVLVSVIQEGGGGYNDKQLLRIARNPATSQDTWSTITNGWAGNLFLNTQGVAELLQDQGEVDATIEVELTDGSGYKYTVLQTPVTLRGEVILGTSPSQPVSSGFYTTAEADSTFLKNLSTFTGLTGGGSSNLDGVPTVGLVVGSEVTVRTSSYDYLYRLKAGTDSESSPLVIRPDDYNASTNAKVWSILNPQFGDLKAATRFGVNITPTVVFDAFAQPTATSGTTPSFRFVSQPLPSGSHTGTVRGVLVSQESYSTPNYTNMHAIASEALHKTTSSLANWLISYQATVQKTNTGAVGSAAGLRVNIDNTNATGTIGYAYGVYVDAFTETGAITNKFGIYVTSNQLRNYFAGNTGIGATASGTARLILGGSDTALAPLRIETGVTPTSPVAGDVWSDIDRQAFGVMVAGAKQMLSGSVFTATATKTFSNTTSETSMIGTGVGSLTLPANFWTVGKTVRLTLRGTVGITGTPTLRIRSKLGSLTICDSTALTMPTLAGATAWTCVMELVCRTVSGASSVMAGSGIFQFQDASGNFGPARIATLNPVASVTFDVASAYAVDVTGQWGTASASNIINGFTATVEIIG